MRTENDKGKKVKIEKNYTTIVIIRPVLKNFMYFLDKKLFFHYKYNQVGSV